MGKGTTWCAPENSVIAEKPTMLTANLQDAERAASKRLSTRILG